MDWPESSLLVYIREFLTLLMIVGMSEDPRILLGNAIRKRRLQMGSSQQTIAEKAGLHLTYVNEVENGKRNVTLFTMLNIARALDSTPSRLLRGIE
jgi:DNA-binding XRE family transcriptional regulator